MSVNGFVKRKTYYRDTVYEWNIPTGSTCPFALECKVTVDRVTGKFDVKKGAYRCYAASAERFPAVRKLRWDNYEYTFNGNIPILPKDCKAVRIHMSGDFYNQAYFDMWLKVAADNPSVEFWAYTKSVKYWINRIDVIPNNLTLTASYGGRNDNLISDHNLKNVKVYKNIDEVEGRPIDTNDNWARIKNVNFALIDNFKTPKAKQNKL
jgi:hypothetical protein